MDEEASTSSTANANPHFRNPVECIYTDTVSIFVDTGWSSSSADFNPTTGVQLCPAIFVPTAQHIPQAVKHIYSRLAAGASELDQGVPELQLSLVGTGNSLSFENSERLIRGLSRIITRCGFWAITSGEQNDPLATAIAAALRITLPTRESNEETLVIVLNSSDVIYRAHSVSSITQQIGSPVMTDSRYNTFYIVWNKSLPSEKELLEFRTLAAINLANPPPALLIGVPDDRSGSNANPTPNFSNQQPAILLPNTLSVDIERRPLPVVLFAASTLVSLFEIQTYLQCGVPVLIIQDVSDLCTALKNAYTLYRSASAVTFDHACFMEWLDAELRQIAVASSNLGEYSESELDSAKAAFCQIISTNYSLLAFIVAKNLENLGENLLDLLASSAIENSQVIGVLNLAVKLNSSSVVVRTSKLESILGEEQLEHLLLEALSCDDRIEVLSALLDQNIPIKISSRLLLSWLDGITDPYFFNTIILGHFLGFSFKLDRISESTAQSINKLLNNLSGGVCPQLFSSDYFTRTNLWNSETTVRHEPLSASKSIQMFAVWALLLNRTELVKLFCAYSNEPIALCLVLAKISRNLAKKSREWFFYEQNLLSLSGYLNETAVTLLDIAYRESPTNAYLLLCRPLSQFNQLTLSQLAYATNARDFIAHECSQRWVLRLLYGNLQIRTISSSFRLPNWFKIVLSAVFVLPITWWVSTRPKTAAHVNNDAANMAMFTRSVSPTVALLEDGRQIKKFRANSIYSTHSMKSNYIHDANNTQFLQNAYPLAQDERSVLNEPETPQSITTNQFFMQSPTQQNCETDSFMISNNVQPQLSQRSASPVSFLGGKKNKGFLHHYAKSNKRQASGSRNYVESFSDIPPKRVYFKFSEFSLFYSTPITKYWISLIFRLIYLIVFSISVALPGCGIVLLDSFLWIWAFMWLIETLWISSIWLQNSSYKEMPWTIFDIICLSTFLTILLLEKIAATYFTEYFSFGSAYTLKATWSIFLLYECYKTLFTYIPLSNILGPLMIRIKLMITKDFVNFFLLIWLVILSSGIAIKSVLYPDLSLSLSTLKQSTLWATMSIFTTDLSILKQSEECHRMRLTRQSDYCNAIGGYADPRCPAQSWIGYFTVMEYMIVLKIISWPILFALFARTAKKVDDEAEQIWKYQLYTLATNFSLRPFLPPPLTPLFFVLWSFCRMSGCINSLFTKFSNSLLETDHPDVRMIPFSSKLTTVYRNPSVPSSKTKSQNIYWRRLSIQHWKLKFKKNPQIDAIPTTTKQFTDRMDLLSLFNKPKRVSVKESSNSSIKSEGRTRENLNLCGISEELRAWSILIPSYCPPSYSKPVNEFDLNVQKIVQEHSAQNLIELGKHWRKRKLSELLSEMSSDLLSDSQAQSKLFNLSGNGLPLNPLGRTGVCGRGNYARFGPNRLFVYVIICRDLETEDLIVLCRLPNQLPSKSRLGNVRPDEFLGHLLTLIGVPDTEIQIMTSRSHLLCGQCDSHLAHVMATPLDVQERIQNGDTDLNGFGEYDTDNAWTEADIWAADLSFLAKGLTVSPAVQNATFDNYEWRSIQESNLPDKISSFINMSLEIFKLKPN